jgi:hypothetical protein
MNDESRGPGRLQAVLNRTALLLSVVVLAAIAIAWWADRMHAWETPRWNAQRFSRLVAPSPGARARWMVVVNPDCLHCRARLAELLRRQRDPARDPALGVLLVDVRRRPDLQEDTSRMDGGVFWDSLGVWRSRWGHRVYGEVLVFAAGGELVRTVGPEGDPQVAGTR